MIYVFTLNGKKEKQDFHPALFVYNLVVPNLVQAAHQINDKYTYKYREKQTDIYM